MDGGVVNGHDADPADGEAIEGGAVRTAGDVRRDGGGGVEGDQEGLHGAVHVVGGVVVGGLVYLGPDIAKVLEGEITWPAVAGGALDFEGEGVGSFADAG